ncbi:hypothetical protein HPB47_020988 [Ixodes persulcatus]|uniref:Uncharacterized protein n=1 Tax=Ixodes persulcatus TaxID=34615 RepID=A0AC60QDU8_IXOPE|nr:hypothetical protein HPB47_020988 [Ixodes persulcatus]
MELHGCAKGLTLFKKEDVMVEALVTDRHLGIKGHMRTKEPQTHHYFDTWHIAKGISKKMLKASKYTRCEVLAYWAQPASNHLYWYATNCKEDEKLLVEMWKYGAASTKTQRIKCVAAVLGIKNRRIGAFATFANVANERKRMLPAKYPDLEKALLLWIKDMLAQDIPLSGPVILAKATDFAQPLGYDDFAASDGWLHRFRERYD